MTANFLILHPIIICIYYVLLHKEISFDNYNIKYLEPQVYELGMLLK